MAKGLSVREVGRRAGVSPTMISQVERNLTEPSLTTMRKLSSVFGESMASVFSESANSAERSIASSLVPETGGEAVWISRPGERLLLSEPRSHFSYERLARGNGHLEVLRAVFEPGMASSQTPWMHPSVECVYVISGTLTVHVNGRDYAVKAGESLTFDARQPHLYRNDGGVAAEAILSITPPMP